MLFFTTIAALFQFHKGTIKTVNSDPELDAARSFQFHKGTIKIHIPEHTRSISDGEFSRRIG